MILYDLYKAKQIIENTVFNYGEKYGTLYSVTNECVKDYSDLFDNKEKALSVMASGDQALEMINHGMTTLDLFDINRLAYYFVQLKIAGVKTLTQEEFIQFFIENKFVKGNDIYAKIRTKLPLNVKMFWDYLITKYGVYRALNGRLFFRYDIEQTKAYLDYIQKDNFNNLKEQIRTTELTFVSGDIRDLKLLNPESYDLVYLSNILDHIYVVKDESVDVDRFLRGFLLNDDGQTICYNLISESKDFEPNYRNELFGNYDIRSVNNSRDTVLIYNKPKGI